MTPSLVRNVSSAAVVLTSLTLQPGETGDVDLTLNPEAVARALGQIAYVPAVRYDHTESYPAGTPVAFQGALYVASGDIAAGWGNQPVANAAWTAAFDPATPAARASTPAAGTALANSTTTVFAQATAPNDGAMHTATVVAYKVTASGTGETGGAISSAFTTDGTTTTNATFIAGATAAATITRATALLVPVDPGTTVTVKQGTALTAGSGSKVFASISIV